MIMKQLLKAVAKKPDKNSGLNRTQTCDGATVSTVLAQLTEAPSHMGAGQLRAHITLFTCV